MTREGPEHRDGWRDAFEVEGHRVEIVARHSTRRRMPSGHQVAMQMSRGRPVEMVAERVFEWIALMGGRRATVRQEPSGRFGVPHGGLHRDTLRGAVTAWAEREARLSAKPAPAEDEAAPGPRWA